MPPLHIEVFHPTNKNWVRVGEIHPTDPKGSMSDNKSDGNRDVYMFGCEPDDSKSTIYRSGAGVDTEVGVFREISMDPSRLEVVRELRNGESYEMDVNTDKSPEKKKVRFIHRKGV